MSGYDKEKIKKLIIKKYKLKIKPEVLNNNIDGLVEEFIENREFVKKNDLKIKDLPTPEEVGLWFEDELKEEDFMEGLKYNDPWMKVDMYKIYQKDKLAKDVYKNLYNLKWSIDKDVNKNIELMIKLLILADRPSTTPENRNIIISRLVNIALLGTVRFYHLERRPFFRESQIANIIKYFFKVLSLIHSIKEGKYKDKKIGGEIYIFKSLEPSSKTKSSEEDEEDEDPEELEKDES